MPIECLRNVENIKSLVLKEHEKKLLSGMHPTSVLSNVVATKLTTKPLVVSRLRASSLLEYVPLYVQGSSY